MVYWPHSQLPLSAMTFVVRTERDPLALGPAAQRVVQFFQPLVQAHAKYLAGNPGARVVIEGNCDERGSREYNLALGQRRADAAKNAMKLLGATETQIESVSFGEEKPKASGHDEASWSQNRRDDIVYKVKQ